MEETHRSLFQIQQHQMVNARIRYKSLLPFFVSPPSITAPLGVRRTNRKAKSSTGNGIKISPKFLNSYTRWC